MVQLSNLKINSFKIFGERHTGTNALSLFLRENFKLKFKYYDFLGWKHRLAPKPSEIEKFDLEETLFVFTFRNPYSWLKSMHREPYYSHYRRIIELEFLNFVQFQIEDYENVITLWNEKNRSYFELLKMVPNGLSIKIEDFHSDQNRFFDLVSKKINFNGQFIPLGNYINGRGESEDKDISTSLMLPSLSEEEIKVINHYLDKDLMGQLNYNLLP